MTTTRILSGTFTLLAAAWLSASLAAQDPFPEVTPAEVGIPKRAIQLLDEQVAKLVESQAMVGVEVHVIKDRKTVLHASYGWADREEERVLQKDSIYCVRSMTKPLAGTAVQILLDEGLITLDQPVAEILEPFRRTPQDQITVRHLLRHRSGLPFTIFEGPLREYDSILEVGEKAAQAELQFEPGSQFQYSDAGTDTLGAVVEKVSGQPLEEVVRSRILKPAGMESAYTLLANLPNRSRVPSAYSGGVGQWQKHWSATDEPILPLFLVSQGLYCTTTDYAKFLTHWMDAGETDGSAIVSPAARKRAFAPGSRLTECRLAFPV